MAVNIIEGIKLNRLVKNKHIIIYGVLLAALLFLIKWLELRFIQATKADGTSVQEIAKKAKEMATFKEAYKKPVFIILLTYMEILPVGLIITLITGLILKRNPDKTTLTVN